MGWNWDALTPEERKQVTSCADKSQMWRTPAEVLGKYCALDVEATYLLYTEILKPKMDRYPGLVDYHEKLFCGTHLPVLIEQKSVGVLVDTLKMQRGEIEVLREIRALEKELYEGPISGPIIRDWEAAAVQSLRDREPERFLRSKLGKEPRRFQKDGSVSSTWAKWKERSLQPPLISKNWQKWKEKVDLAEAGKIEETKFNLQSSDLIRWLMYDKLGYTPLEFSETGLPSVDGESLTHMGPVGNTIAKLITARKEHQFFEAYLEFLKHRDTLHPGFRTPGTLTGRLSGTSPNFQQVVKTRRFLEPMRARPGCVWIDADITSLEVVVCTELSGDPQLMQVFGPSAPKGTDIYLHTGVGLPQFSAAIRAAGYDPEKGITPEGTAAAKKKCKRERDICKVLYLSSSYGAGPRKIHKTLQMQGVDVSLDEVAQMHKDYWNLYGGIRQWERRLMDEWRGNGGWVLNGMGRPIGIHKDYTKDIVNRVVQSTGHDFLILFGHLLVPRLTGIDWAPIFWDFHDETIIEVREDQAEEVVRIFKETEQEWNAILGGTIPLRINPVIVNNLAEAKIEG